LHDSKSSFLSRSFPQSTAVSKQLYPPSLRKFCKHYTQNPPKIHALSGSKSRTYQLKDPLLLAKAGGLGQMRHFDGASSVNLFSKARKKFSKFTRPAIDQLLPDLVGVTQTKCQRGFPGNKAFVESIDRPVIILMQGLKAQGCRIQPL